MNTSAHYLSQPTSGLLLPNPNHETQSSILADGMFWFLTLYLGASRFIIPLLDSHLPEIKPRYHYGQLIVQCLSWLQYPVQLDYCLNSEALEHSLGSPCTLEHWHTLDWAQPAQLNSDGFCWSQLGWSVSAFFLAQVSSPFPVKPLWLDTPHTTLVLSISRLITTAT